MVKALVFGKNGQLARSLAEVASEYPDISLQFVDRYACDLSQPFSVVNVIETANPDVIINAAAYTSVDKAETESSLAHTINGEAVGHIAAVASRCSIPLIHISTDYVFDGNATEPYRETDVVRPANAYGESKLAGEIAIREIAPYHLILRTSWVYSPYGRNFVKVMLSLMAERDELRVVSDQIGCPTSALELASAILRCVPDLMTQRPTVAGTYHLASPNAMSWFGFAKQIQAAARDVFGGSWRGGACKVVPIRADEFSSVARRPKYSVLSDTHFKRTFGFGLLPTDEGLLKVLAAIGRSQCDA
ncbi:MULTISPECIES: dTDP-4-dehydrorhamnose reductase [unclassified Thalassospira]|uniref:dTDP-4-dehydrorhamnose reductase n=1 Tax=unclassified Thalassospira TaxID=2648997 RepID=UPI0009CFD2C6|nr:MULTISPECIES: dTDP-4-dehydrorhamnose reductase [unclassified Thalassospira]ONH85966.1 dTDP-4-dehydrorhamnose reductase [Thalassospira sp. MCCC 1A02803]